VTADAPKECEGAGEVVFIIFLRIRDRLADRAERSEVYNRNDVMRFERIDKLVRIPYVGNDERTPFRKMRMARREIVVANGLVSGLGKGLAAMRPDITGSARHQYA
jgi:hypothetical protein